MSYWEERRSSVHSTRLFEQANRPEAQELLEDMRDKQGAQDRDLKEIREKADQNLEINKRLLARMADGRLNPIEDIQFSGWNLPQRNPNFTGRQDLLDQIEQTLNKGHRGALTQAVGAGLGGVGKSQLALEYAYRHYDNQPNVVD